MNWYYANGGEKQGPVDQAVFDGLAAEGVIQHSTLVWREGLPEWQRYADITPAMYCVECGKPFSTGFMFQYGASWICANCKPRFAQKIREGTLFHSAIPYAGFWIRFGARMIDGVALTIVNTIINLFFFGIRPFHSAAIMMSLATVYSAQFAVAATYESFFVWRFSATPGKMLLGLKVVKPDGSKLSLGLSIGRYAATLVTNFTMGIGHAMAAVDDQKQALHDRMCNTRVIKKR